MNEIKKNLMLFDESSLSIPKNTNKIEVKYMKVNKYCGGHAVEMIVTSLFK